MWNTLGIRHLIVRGGHLVDDWIESSCLSGMSLFLFCIFGWGFGFLGGRRGCGVQGLIGVLGLSTPAPCPGEFPDCGAGYL